jgi:hypothetical protein
MSWKLYLRLAELLVTAILTLSLAAAWRADRNDRAQLSLELSAAKQALTLADSRQHDRDTQLLQTLAALAADKRETTSPIQILRDLPSQLALPQPITLQTAPGPPDAHKPSTGETKTSAPQPQAVIPYADLKPLYDFAVDCKACQSKLTTAQADLADEKSKTAIVAKERDAALKVAKGGSVLRRIARAAKWFAIGAAAGAIAVRAHH